MKKSAVEWLVEEMLKGNFNMKNIIKQAKEMEKQQIIDAYGELCLWDSKEEAEQYYNEQFNK